MRISRPTGVLPTIVREVILTSRDACKEPGVAVCGAPQALVESTIPVTVPKRRSIMSKRCLTFVQDAAVV